MFRTLISLILWPLTFIVFTFVVGGGYLFLLLFIHPEKLHPFARIICRILLTTGGQWLSVRGTPPPKIGQPYLYLFNHQSLFDSFMLAAAIPHYITAVGANKQFSWPVWGYLVRRYGVIPIKRRKLKAAIHSLHLAEEAVQKGTSFIISPEGTRTLTGEMGQFKKGAFHVAKNTGITIVPVGIQGAFDAKNKNDWRLTPGILTIHFGELIKKEEYNNMTVEQLRDFTRNKISELIQSN